MLSKDFQAYELANCAQNVYKNFNPQKHHICKETKWTTSIWTILTSLESVCSAEHCPVSTIDRVERLQSTIVEDNSRSVPGKLRFCLKISTGFVAQGIGQNSSQNLFQPTVALHSCRLDYL